MNFSVPLWLWIAFNAFVLVMLALDLGVFHLEIRKAVRQQVNCRLTGH